MEKKIFEILSSYREIEKTKQDFQQNLLESEVTEKSQDLRNYAISKLGWSEKSGELSSGGELNDDFTKILNELIYDYSKVAPGCKGQFTAGNDKFHHGIKDYVSRHTKGEAVDVTLPEGCRESFVQLLKTYTTKHFGFSFLDEYKKPTKKATGGHFHISYRKSAPEGSSGGGAPEKTSDTSITTDGSTPEPSGSLSEPSNIDTGLVNVGKQVFSKMGLKESSFGNKAKTKSGGIIVLPASIFKNINSITSGEIQRPIDIKNCRNGFIIDSTTSKYKVEYCFIDDVKVNFGKIVDDGDLLGRTITDVEVRFYDKSDSRYSSIPTEFTTTNNTKNKDTDLDKTKDKKSNLNIDTSASDKVLAGLFKLPFTPFQDKYDEKTGELKQKRFGSPTDKREVDPWIIDTFKNMFKKKKEGNLQEQINKIKKLIK